MKKSLPLVTVVGLCYNQDLYVLETLDSIYRQTYTNLQVILIDDYSQDNSVNIIENWLIENNLNWVFIRHKQNKGICKSLNEALDLTEGLFFKVIACDDILLPDFINDMVIHFEHLSEDFALLYSDVQPIDKHSNTKGKTPFEERGWINENSIPSGRIFEKLAGWCFIPAPSTFIRSRVVKEIRFDEQLLFEDWDMWLQISRKYLIKGIPDLKVKYRIHDKSVYQLKSPAYRDHELRTVEKHLGFSKLGDAVIKDFIYRNSMQLYLHSGNRKTYWLWRRFLIKKTLKNFFHVICSLF